MSDVTVPPGSSRLPWQFLDEAALGRRLAVTLVTDTLLNSNRPGPGEKAVRTVLNGFARLLAEQRPPFVRQEQRGHASTPWLHHAWWCTGLADAPDGTAVVLCLPQREHRSLDATLDTVLGLRPGALADGWLAIGNTTATGVPPEPLRTVGSALLIRWLSLPNAPHHRALLDLAAQVPDGGLATALIALERAQLLSGLASSDETTPARVTRSRL